MVYPISMPRAIPVGRELALASCCQSYGRYDWRNLAGGRLIRQPLPGARRFLRKKGRSDILYYYIRRPVKVGRSIWYRTGAGYRAHGRGLSGARSLGLKKCSKTSTSGLVLICVNFYDCLSNLRRWTREGRASSEPSERAPALPSPLPPWANLRRGVIEDKASEWCVRTRRPERSSRNWPPPDVCTAGSRRRWMHWNVYTWMIYIYYTLINGRQIGTFCLIWFYA